MSPLSQLTQWAAQRRKLRGFRHITDLDRLQLWRVSESMDYRLQPDEIEARWTEQHIREWCEYQQLLSYEHEQRHKNLNI